MAALNTQHDARPYRGSAVSPGRFGLLLIVLTGSYLLSAFATGRWIDALRVILFALVILSFRVSRSCDLRRPVVDSVADGTLTA